MKYLSGLFIISVLTFFLSGRLYAQPVESASNLQERIEKLESELQELKTLLKWHGKWATGANLSYRTDAIRQLGGYSPDIGYGEDGVIVVATGDA